MPPSQLPQAKLLPIETMPHYELLRIKKVDAECDPAQKKWVYETAVTGYMLFIGRPAIFGGLSLGAAMQSALESVYEELGPEAAAQFTPYSFQGTFAGPALPHYALRCEVTTVRSTRSFITRVVYISQVEPGKPETKRNTLVAICDIARKGRKALLEFDAPAINPVTNKPWEKVDELDLYSNVIAGKIAQAKSNNNATTLKYAETEARFIGRWNGLYQFKIPPDSLTHQSYWATRPELSTAQDNVPLTERVMADYFRFEPDLSPPSLARISAQRPDCVPFRPETAPWMFLSFTLDQIVPVTAMLTTKTPRAHSAPDVSLDFSVRFHCEDGIDLNSWILRHFKCPTARAGRTFNQITLWDSEQRIVATMSQQGHLVPAPPPKKLQPKL